MSPFVDAIIIHAESLYTILVINFIPLMFLLLPAILVGYYLSQQMHYEKIFHGVLILLIITCVLVVLLFYQFDWFKEEVAGNIQFIVVSESVGFLLGFIFGKLAMR
jgi:hypothetical protein